jgi:hypothetical protein
MLGPPAMAQAEATPGDADGGAQLTVYGWLAGASGEFTPFAGAPTIAFDDSFGDVLQDIDSAFFATAQFRRDRFVMVGDVSYAALSREGRLPLGIKARAEIQQLAITALAGARVVAKEDVSLDLLAGARLWDIDGEIAVPLVGRSVAPGKTFVDPIVAARLNAGIAPRLSTTVQADVGGVGIGSDFTYQLVGTLNYQIARKAYLSAGWRHLYLEFDDAGTVFDASQTGPLLGFTYRF